MSQWFTCYFCIVLNVCNITAQKYLLYTNDWLYHTVQALNQISQWENSKHIRCIGIPILPNIFGLVQRYTRVSDCVYCWTSGQVSACCQIQFCSLALLPRECQFCHHGLLWWWLYPGTKGQICHHDFSNDGVWTLVLRLLSSSAKLTGAKLKEFYCKLFFSIMEQTDIWNAPF